MKHLDRLLFWYCLFISGFLLLSSGLSLPIIPIFGYFLYHSVIYLTKKTPLPTNPISKPTWAILLFTFILFTCLAVFRILTHKKPLPHVTKLQLQKILPTPILSPTPATSIGIIQSDPSLGRLNVRRSASLTSPIVGKVHSGQKFNVTSTKDDWIQIVYTASESAWIPSDFIQVSSPSAHLTKP
ncbi:MAG: SH3 domain-containing protein [Candidatus Roizmanbacteria bacterium]